MINYILEDYKKTTEKIIENIKNDLDIDELMKKREELIKELFKNENIDNNDIKELYLTKGLLDLDRKLKLTIEEEQLKVKEEIRNIHKRKNANNAYEKNKRVNNFFSTKI
ncbi:hypothetical protein SDC9_120167 [bioreactor metagenome]|uniref:Flagellar protein FliT n=1 Tax=bioreactor metagenome TaxID=1076179 RepID=A0A645C7V9_9ZZZZ